MTGFFRPELVAALARYREALALGAAALLALWWLWSWWDRGAWLPGALGALILPVALFLLRQAVLRARFRTGGLGPGVLRVTEQQITYLGPVEGGVLAIPEITRVELRPGPDGPLWRLHHAGGPPLEVPAGAEGADALFDALAALPGMEAGRMVLALERAAAHPVILWSRGEGAARLTRS